MSKTVRSNENIFRAFGISSASARNLQIRSLLMIELEKFIRHRGMTQVQAADYFGVSQPYISDLLNGRIDRVSIDKLVTLLDLAGRSVTLKVGRKAARRQAATGTYP
jgi:predicted XRE-type DNA-binding protein